MVLQIRISCRTKRRFVMREVPFRATGIDILRNVMGETIVRYVWRRDLRMLGAFLLVSLVNSQIGLARQKSTEPMGVLAAIAPIEPPSHSIVEISVVVRVNARGNVVTVRMPSGRKGGLRLYSARDIMEQARQWRFTPDPGGVKMRTACITFAFKHTLEDELLDEQRDVVFVPPYRLEVIYRKPSILRGGYIRIRVCPVHGEEMQTDVVKIRYGECMFLPDYREAKHSLFPEANTVYYGGCIRLDFTRAEVLYCRRCREAEEQWEKEHRRDKDRPQ